MKTIVLQGYYKPVGKSMHWGRLEGQSDKKYIGMLKHIRRVKNRAKLNLLK